MPYARLARKPMVTLRFIVLASAAIVWFMIGCDDSGGAREEGRAVARQVGGAVTPDEGSYVSLVSEALRRLRAAAAGKQGTFAVLLQMGEGEKAEGAYHALEGGLSKEPQFALSTVSRVHEAPVADINSPGQHVHPVSYQIKPPPDLVVRVWESENKLIIAAREPGRDPLGPSDKPWLWLLELPRQ